MSWHEYGMIAGVLSVVLMLMIAWAISGGHKKPPITRDLDRHQDPDNYA